VGPVAQGGARDGGRPSAPIFLRYAAGVLI
jgi:hypothetical protein